MRCPAVDVKRTIVSDNLLLCIEPDVQKVLVPEHQRATLCGQECKFVQSF